MVQSEVLTCFDDLFGIFVVNIFTKQIGTQEALECLFSLFSVFGVSGVAYYPKCEGVLYNTGDSISLAAGVVFVDNLVV